MAKDAREDALAASQRQAKEDFKAAEERQSGQPTPTQEENDRAKLGFDSLKELDAKEDDGSGPDPNDPKAPAKK
jgi:hypothetical protein